MTDDPEVWRERALRDAVLAGDAAAWGRWLGEAFAPVADYVRWRCGGVPDLNQVGPPSGRTGTRLGKPSGG